MLYVMWALGKKLDVENLLSVKKFKMKTDVNMIEYTREMVKG